MKTYGNKDGYIRSNLDEVNKHIAKIYTKFPEAANYIAMRVANDLHNRLVLNSPVQTGNLRGNWGWDSYAEGHSPQPPKQIKPALYRIQNPTEYIIDVEYGVKSHSLSEDPEKRKASLRFLFATGILEEQDGIIVSTYTPKGSASTGFIRRTLEVWKPQAIQNIKKYLLDWTKKQFEGK